MDLPQFLQLKDIPNTYRKQMRQKTGLVDMITCHYYAYSSKYPQTGQDYYLHIFKLPLWKRLDLRHPTYSQRQYAVIIPYRYFQGENTLSKSTEWYDSAICKTLSF